MEDKQGAKSHRAVNDTSRILYIENYRNLGINRRTHLTINRTLNSEEMGGLIFLIGPNNSGKSNVLDALESISEGTSIRDFIDGQIQSAWPSIILRINDTVDSYGIKSGAHLDPESIDWGEEDNPRFRDLMGLIFNDLYKNGSLPDDKKQLFSMMSGHETQCMEYLKQTVDSTWLMKNGYSQEDCSFYDGFLNQIYQVDVKDPAAFEIEYGFRPRPQIFRYRQVPVSDQDCKGTLGNYSLFLDNMMKFLFADDLKVLEELAAQERNGEEEEQFRKLCSQAEIKLRDMSQYFNSLCGLEKLDYDFRLSIDGRNVEFEIYLGDNKQKLEWSSLGFKWFFDFYFNFLYSRRFEVGDIVLMDEPALNLHISSQRELAKRLREYAEKSGVTFVISTHSPFMIDIDYLDEVRLVVRDSDGSSRIIDNFQEATKSNSDPSDNTDGDPDTLKPILDALTIEKHTIVDPDSKIFFVEGVTDYLLFNAFKDKYGMNNIHFMPVGGLGSYKDSGYREHLIECLKSIDHEPTLIVDGDSAGDRMKFAREKGIRVISLGEILGCKDLERLFDKEDYDSILVRKETNKYCVFRHFIDRYYDSLSQNTKDRFAELFQKFRKDIESSISEREYAKYLFSGYVKKYCRSHGNAAVTVEDVAFFAGKIYATFRIPSKQSANSGGMIIKFEEEFPPVIEMFDKLDGQLELMMSI